MGLTQEKFAEKIGIQWHNLIDIENGKYLPRPENIDRICERLNIPICTLFELSEDISNKKSEKMKLINLKLSAMDEEKFNIAFNIICNAFD